MKLTKSIKEQIISAIVSKKITDNVEALEKKKKEYTIQYIQEELKKHEKWIKQAPEGFLLKRDRVRIDFGEGWGEYSYINLGEELTIPAKWQSCEVRIKIEDKEWKNKFKQVHLELKKFENYKKDLRSELIAVMMPCSTIAKLLRVVPEINEYVDLSQFHFYAPVVQTDKLKRLLLED